MTMRFRYRAWRLPTLSKSIYCASDLVTAVDAGLARFVMLPASPVRESVSDEFNLF